MFQPEIPPHLKIGDEIRIISTARKISMDEVSPAQFYLEKKGFRVTFGKNLFKVFNQFAGTDQERLSDFQYALDDPDVRMIWFARGGYGSHRLVKGLSLKGFIKHPKWLVGYSDITVWHCLIQAKCSIPTLHATMPVNFKDQSPVSFDALIKGVSSGFESVSFESDKRNREGKAKGRLVGGNLSILYSLIGTDVFKAFKGMILFIEDLDEYLYHIDRMMMSFILAGIFENLSGLIIGGMSDMNDNAVPFGHSVEEIISEAVKNYQFPVAFGFPAGHQYHNHPLMLGVNAELKVKNTGSELIY